MPSPKAAVRNKLRKLAATIEELRTDKNLYFAINITRLLSIKSLCDNHEIAKQFVFFLACRTVEKMEEKACPIHMEPQEWMQTKGFAVTTLQQLQYSLEHPDNEQENSFRMLKQKVHNFQNTHQPGKHGLVRVIQSSDVLLLEYALECMTSSDLYGTWAYSVARQYAERFEGPLGAGLIPESIPMLEEILDFWHRYYYAQEGA